VEFRRDVRLVILSLGDESSHDFSINSQMVISNGSFESPMDCGNMTSQVSIVFLVDSIKEKEKQIKSGEKGCGEVDIFMRGLILVVSSVERVGSSKN